MNLPVKGSGAEKPTAWGAAVLGGPWQHYGFSLEIDKAHEPFKRGDSGSRLLWTMNKEFLVEGA